MRKLFTWALLLLGFLLTSACTPDNFEEAGICVRCTRVGTATVPALDVEACSNGDGTITVTLDGLSTTSENDTETFRTTQEASGATCM